jgi:anti-sigma regulatory factor (Ser/Thr protein kinase)
VREFPKEDAMPSERAGPVVEIGQATVVSGRLAPSAARTLVARWLCGHGLAALHDDACLLVSELVTNSIRHAGQPAGAPVQIRATVTDGAVRFAVDDLGRGPVRPRAPDFANGAAGGFGLQMLETIATRWGVDHARGTQVWFELGARHAAT